MVTKKDIFKAIFIASGVGGAVMVAEALGLLCTTFQQILAWPGIPILGYPLSIKLLLGLSTVYVFIEYARSRLM